MKDWMTKAAEEILGKYQVRDSHSPHDFVMDSERISSIIAKHHARIVKPDPGHLQDWAARAGAYLHAEGVRLSSHRIAAVVAHFAEPVMRLLREARREHSRDKADPCYKVFDLATEDTPCTCGADEFNARIDEALK